MRSKSELRAGLVAPIGLLVFRRYIRGLEAGRPGD
jgi:hypothetical protein